MNTLKTPKEGNEDSALWREIQALRQEKIALLEKNLHDLQEERDNWRKEAEDWKRQAQRLLSDHSDTEMLEPNENKGFWRRLFS